MKSVITIICLAIGVLGCVKPCPPAPKPETLVIREYIVVPAPEPTIPPRPLLPSANLKDLKELTIQDLAKILLADRELLTAWGLDLETRLKAYLNQTQTQQRRDNVND